MSDLDVSRVIVVWSSYGHRFMSTDFLTHKACMTCGAMYELVVPDPSNPTRGEYRNFRGEPPKWCSGRTDLAHGYRGERACDDPACDPSEPCEHVTHDCDCLICDS